MMLEHCVAKGTVRRTSVPSLSAPRYWCIQYIADDSDDRSILHRYRVHRKVAVRMTCYCSSRCVVSRRLNYEENQMFGSGESERRPSSLWELGELCHLAGYFSRHDFRPYKRMFGHGYQPRSKLDFNGVVCYAVVFQPRTESIVRAYVSPVAELRSFHSTSSILPHRETTRKDVPAIPQRCNSNTLPQLDVERGGQAETYKTLRDRAENVYGF